MNRFLALLLILAPLLPAMAADGCAPNEVLITDEFGDPQCKLTTVALSCPGGDAYKYFDQQLNRMRCCPVDSKLQIFNQQSKAGICCPAGQYYATDSTGGKCCPIGQVLTAGVCAKPKEPTPPVPQPQPGNCTPRVCPGPCTLTPVCGDDKTNGLNYGSCYVMTFPDGKQLGRRRDDWYYEKDGYIQDIPFKVCKAATDCSKYGAVGPDSPFYLEDQLGGVRDAKGSTGWIDGASNGNHLSMTSVPTLAGRFKGRTSCANGECAIQLFGGPDEGGLTYACPMQTPGITFWANKKVGMKMQFAEVPCDGDWPAFKAAKAAGTA